MCICHCNVKLWQTLRLRNELSIRFAGVYPSWGLQNWEMKMKAVYLDHFFCELVLMYFIRCCLFTFLFSCERAKKPGITEKPQCCVPGFFTDFNICSCSGFYCQALHMISASQTFSMYYLVMTFSEWHLWCTIHSCFEFAVQWADFRHSKEIWLARLHQAWIRFW